MPSCACHLHPPAPSHPFPPATTLALPAVPSRSRSPVLPAAYSSVCRRPRTQPPRARNHGRPSIRAGTCSLAAALNRTCSRSPSQARAVVRTLAAANACSRPASTLLEVCGYSRHGGRHAPAAAPAIALAVAYPKARSPALVGHAFPRRTLAPTATSHPHRPISAFICHVSNGSRLAFALPAHPRSQHSAPATLYTPQHSPDGQHVALPAPRTPVRFTAHAEKQPTGAGGRKPT